MTPSLLEYFAAHETLSDMDHPDVTPFSMEFAESLAGPKPDGKWDSQPIWEWEAKWRAKLKFIRANAMVDELGEVAAAGIYEAHLKYLNKNFPD